MGLIGRSERYQGRMDATDEGIVTQKAQADKQPGPGVQVSQTCLQKEVTLSPFLEEYTFGKSVRDPTRYLIAAKTVGAYQLLGKHPLG